MGQKMREIGEQQVKILGENVVPPLQRSVGVANYDLCAIGSCVIPSRGKGAMDIGLTVSLPLGTYARIAPYLGLAIQIFINVGAEVDSDYWVRSNWYFSITLRKTL